ncbi:hypothetical protein FDP41_000308 [Naegleria fowleri]|uniref:Uncharacterized protein n=1 Tax=Naegleria fowleri TaxID=5763 RepID=A0A6A5CGI0_NAEFO|nr:uncharacterized protein FDP41_000308 [Naegleria fowleri]KAF0984409.1 hypothetical protein FDP41_000308 [Naegleria fowleri]CAG4717906.1 unnamed protein product [Naegleria fowleri]
MNVAASNDSRANPSSETYNPFYSISKQIASLKMNLVRMTFHGTIAPDTFDPESSDYWQGIGTLALGGGILSIIAILMLLCCDTFRAFGCFGGVEPTKQFFYGREPRKEPYGMCQVFTLKILIGVALLVVTGLVVLLIIGNVIFNNAFEYGRSNFKSGLNTMFNQSIELQIVTNRIQVASGSNAQLTDISSLMAQQQASMNATSTLTKEIRHMNFIRYFLLMLIALVILFVPLLGLLSGLTHWKEFAAYGVRFGYMMLVCCWILYTLHFAFAVVTQDMCATADRYLQGQYSNNTGNSDLVKQISSLVQIFSKCSNQSVLVANSGIDMSLIDTMIASLNQQLTKDDPRKRYFNIVYANLSSAVNIDYVQANPQTKANVQKSVNTIYLFHDDLIPTFMTYNNCSHVGQSFVNVVDSGCVGMLSSMNIMWTVYLVLGVLLFPIIWLNCLGYKRFRKKRFVLPKERKIEDIDIALNLH